MATRHTLGYSVLLIGLTATIYFSVFSGDNELALNTLFLGLYATVSVLFFLKILYYIQFKATLNEMYFLFFSNFIPLFIIAITTYIPLGKITLLTLDISLDSGSFFSTLSTLRITILSIMAIPFILVAIGLLTRCFIRYDFIRYTSQSTKGPSAEWTAILSFLIFGSLFFLVGQFAGDLLSLFLAFTYIINAVGFFFSRL